MDKSILNSKEINQLIDEVNLLNKKIDFLEAALHENHINWYKCDICGNPFTELLVIPFRQCGIHSGAGSNGIKLRIEGNDKYFCWHCIPNIYDTELSLKEETEKISTIAYWIKRYGQYKLYLIRKLPEFHKLFSEEEIIDAEMQFIP